MHSGNVRFLGQSGSADLRLSNSLPQMTFGVACRGYEALMAAPVGFGFGVADEQFGLKCDLFSITVSCFRCVRGWRLGFRLRFGLCFRNSRAWLVVG